jgi:hypothetical protein
MQRPVIAGPVRSAAPEGKSMKKGVERVAVNALLPKKQYDQLTTIADRQERSLAATVRIAVQLLIERERARAQQEAA